MCTFEYMPSNTSIVEIYNLLDYHLGPEDASFTLTMRLARENLWSYEYAERVCNEYKKFMFLAAVHGPVTPSVAVDQAWHLHLLYTDDYDEFCAMLGKRIKHGPTKGGHSEHVKFYDMYQRTLDHYYDTFKTPPPEDIWPSATKRFGSDTDLVWVNTTDNWIVPVGKPKLLLKALKSELLHTLYSIINNTKK